MVPARPFFSGRPGGAVERMNLAFFVDHRTMACAGGSSIEPDDVAQFVDKRGSLDSLNWRIRCGCRPWARQMRWTELTHSPATCAIEAQVQWGRLTRRVAKRQGDHALRRLGASSLIREGRVLSRTRPSNPSSRKRFLPAPNASLGLGRSPHDLVRADAIGGQQHELPARQTCFCGAFAVLAPQL